MQDENSCERYSNEERWKMWVNAPMIMLSDDDENVRSYRPMGVDDLWRLYRPRKKEECEKQIGGRASAKQNDENLVCCWKNRQNQNKQSAQLMITFEEEDEEHRDSVSQLVLPFWRQGYMRRNMLNRFSSSFVRTNLKCTFKPRRSSPRALPLFKRFWLEPSNGNHWSRS